MLDTLVFGCVAFPLLAALAVYFVRGEAARRLIVPGAVAVTALSALGMAGSGPIMFAPKSFLGIGLDGLIAFLDFALLFYILYLGTKMRHLLIMGMTVLQIVGLIYLEFFLMDHGATVPGFYVDSLSLTMVLIISFVGGLICVYGLGYMKEHEEHLHLPQTKQPRFFFFVVLFLGAMNGLVLSNNLAWMYFFWEITTLCSFMLIGHDGTDEAKTNATRALWMNMVGGVAFVFALLFLQKGMGTLSVQDVLARAVEPEMRTTAVLLPMAMLCLAGFTKSAQLPFQSWLCGAMVAPTPVSALLHSSTMVKAGVYLILRMAPGYAGTALSTGVALFGAFTFIVTSALAAGQSNGKKILAYSTIANLGLIVACAGINTAASVAAAMMLIIFHAISKGLLFLCVGAIEQKIGSRNIEDMRNLFERMPRTAVITVIGIVTMMLPPFGMLIAKWMAIESAAGAMSAMPLLVIMIALGSALTVLFWARWAGIMLGSSRPGFGPMQEEQDITIRLPLVSLVGGALVLSLLAPFVYTGLVEPAIAMYAKASAYGVSIGTIGNTMGAFAVYPLYLLLGAGFYYAWRAARNTPDSAASLPYMGGSQMTQDGVVGFNGPMNQFVPNAAGNYYLEKLFGEAQLTKPGNVVAIVLLILMIGGML
ncbi:NADH-quinone oxidoreductase subunit L [Nitratidesulfovibrio vulgaris]|uniref:NADH-quinone oxidoreductase subunit 5 family protein n=1 Tax=Nitratidesulfovibrio vulgaris TaxID=881 RepID=UPI0013DF4906|nr:NADH-quinone oxidoreductase subunit L [Nitratidesulfovibrio vulgaris]